MCQDLALHLTSLRTLSSPPCPVTGPQSGSTAVCFSGCHRSRAGSGLAPLVLGVAQELTGGQMLARKPFPSPERSVCPWRMKAALFLFNHTMIAKQSFWEMSSARAPGMNKRHEKNKYRKQSFSAFLNSNHQPPISAQGGLSAARTSGVSLHQTAVLRSAGLPLRCTRASSHGASHEDP